MRSWVQLMVPLRLLRPRWLEEQGRPHLGLEIDCPRHPDGHRVRLWFQNPPDGGPAHEAGAGAWRVWLLADVDDIDRVTLLPAAGLGTRPVALGHWEGWIVEGEVTEAQAPDTWR